MRIRQVKPAFWADARLGSLPEAVRLFYIGLWMEADDAGYFRWDPVEIARDLYGFDSRIKREKRVVQMFDRLLAAGRVEVYPCGHGFVPKLTDHQRLSVREKQVRTFEKEHERCTRGDPRVAVGDPTVPRPVREGVLRTVGGNGTGSEDKVARPLAASGAAGAPSEFDAAMAAAGFSRPKVLQ